MTAQSPSFHRTKYACYFAYLAMSSVFSLPPLLFVTFREMYGISYTLLGTLVLVNFCTQLLIDLIFSFFSKYFNVRLAVRVMPLLTSLGLLIYAIVPALFPDKAYTGLLIGTLVFSVSAGLSEVLLSPIVAALPSEHPERDMSMLHSLYAWGVLTVVAVSTVFLKIFGGENWIWLTLFWAVLPCISCVFFCLSPMPEMNLAEQSVGGKAHGQAFGMALCAGCIFLGSAAENVMTNWISGYMETALQIPKAMGDVCGMAAFAVLLGLVRTLYARYGRNISTVLLLGMLGTSLCYLTAALASNGIVSMLACVFTGFCTAMLWPGTLIFMEEQFPNPGVAAYALMAAGGDFGGSVAPQLMGIIVDKVAASSWAAGYGASLSLSADQIGMKVGMLTASIFPILGVILLLYMKRYFRRRKDKALSL